jgi:hypothetical protein
MTQLGLNIQIMDKLKYFVPEVVAHMATVRATHEVGVFSTVVADLLCFFLRRTLARHDLRRRSRLAASSARNFYLGRRRGGASQRNARPCLLPGRDPVFRRSQKFAAAGGTAGSSRHGRFSLLGPRGNHLVESYLRPLTLSSPPGRICNLSFAPPVCRLSATCLSPTSKNKGVKKIELFCGDYGDRNFAVSDLSFNATMFRTGLSRNKFSTLKYCWSCTTRPPLACHVMNGQEEILALLGWSSAVACSL